MLIRFWVRAGPQLEPIQAPKTASAEQITGLSNLQVLSLRFRAIGLVGNRKLVQTLVHLMLRDHRRNH